MNREDIIRMAREAGKHQWPLEPEFLERFAALVVAHEREVRSLRWDELIAKAVEAEREACAKVCDLPDGLDDWEIFGGADGRAICNDLAAAIRARRNAK